MQKGFANQAVVFICTSHINAYTIYNCTSTEFNVSRRLRSQETRGGHAAWSDTPALSDYSLFSVAVFREIVISINYNCNKLDSSEISFTRPR